MESHAPNLNSLPRSGEQSSEVLPANKEADKEKLGAPEQSESRNQGSQGAAPIVSTPITYPSVAPVDNNATKVVQDDTTNPLIASDDDVIEKAWVDKAKQIVAETKDDPYQQEREVSKLQADYLKKRYGKIVNNPGV